MTARPVTSLPWAARFIGLVLLPALASGAGAGYDVEFAGVPRALHDAVRRESLAHQLQEQGQVSARILEARALRDAHRLGRLLESMGYFGHEIRHELTPDEEGRNHRLVYHIATGPRYTMGAVEVRRGDGVVVLDGYAGEMAGDDRIDAAMDDALRQSRQAGHPWARTAAAEVHVDRVAARIRLVIAVEEGPRARLGPIQMIGVERTDPDYVRARVSLREDDWFDQREVERTRRNLAATDLFNVLRILPAEEPDPDGRVPIRIELRERRFRTISASLHYETDLGPGAGAGFEHRNLLGHGERYRSRWEQNDLQRRWENRLLKPNWGRPGQDVGFLVDLKREDSDAYEADSVLGEVSLSRRLGEQWSAGLGIGYEYSRITQGGLLEHFRLWSMPATVSIDTSNDLLDADRGFRGWVEGSPYVDFGAGGTFFVKSAVGLRTYHRLHREPRVVLAGRLSLGTINAATRDDVPANTRFYAGGGGSIRGYAYQTVGPLDAEGDPLGGRSLVEGSLELRGPLYGNLGLVLFVDAGTAAASTVPAEDQEVLAGGGAGLRYATPIGPLRADVAIPLDRRHEIDRGVQFYISIGQAF
jgi:translocation and assembly module TamA